MARKVKAPDAPVKPSAPDVGADDLAITHPNARVTIAGRALVVREYELGEGLGIRALMKPFSADLLAMFTSGEALVEDILDLLGTHRQLTQQAIAQSIAPAGEQATGDDIAWIAGLNDADGDLLINTWWSICGPFFLRQVTRRFTERARRKVFVGATSTPSSSSVDTAPPAASDTTPSASSSSSTTG